MQTRTTLLLALLCTYTLYTVYATQTDDGAGITPVVAEHYEELPYPPRDPEDERRRLVKVVLAEPLEISHYVYGGKLKQRLQGLRESGEKFRVLVAGGGTGDASIYAATRLSGMNVPHEVVHLDLSSASIAIAQKRAEVRGLTSIRFIQGSLLDAASLGIGEFDFINTCGVLHHLDNPSEGLSALASVVKPDGGIGVMVYAQLGRTGVYDMQAIMRHLLAGSKDSMSKSDQVALTRRTVDALPESNWFKRNTDMNNCGDMQADDYGDEGVYDLLLHARDTPFQVTDVVEWVNNSNLRLVDFFQSAAYEPASYVSDPTILKHAESLTRFDRYHLGELITGHLKKHIFYAVPHTNTAELPSYTSKKSIPCQHVFFGKNIANLPNPPPVEGDTLARYNISVKLQMKDFSFSLPYHSAFIIRHINCENTLTDIHKAVAKDVAESGLHKKKKKMSWSEFVSEWKEVYNALHGVGWITLARA